MLNHIGATTAMDVIFPESTPGLLDTDSERLSRIMANDAFFMDTTIHDSKKDPQKILQETFDGQITNNTVLVMSWPRKFALPYLKYFFLNGGRSVFFVRGGASSTIFSKEYLGELESEEEIATKGTELAKQKFLEYIDTVAFKHNMNKALQASISLFTSTSSTLDLYSFLPKTPARIALSGAIERLKNLEW